MTPLHWLRNLVCGDPAVLKDWTPRRAAQAERDTRTAEGRVVEPSYLWSQVAQAHEMDAIRHREQAQGHDRV